MSIVSQLVLPFAQTQQTVYGPFITREQALEKGLSHYFTGIACRNGHVSVRGVRKWNCLECDRKQKAAERARDPERVRANEMRTAMRNRRKKAELARLWRERNPDRCREHATAKRLRYWRDSDYREHVKRVYNDNARRQREKKSNRAISQNLRCRVYLALVRQTAVKQASLRHLLGCGIPELRQHLEAQFQAGMSWENYGKDGWHIDHVRPCASFDLRDPEQQRQCFHYSNLQPLWAIDNIRKGARVA